MIKTNNKHLTKQIKSLRDVLGSGWSARNISTELAHRTGLPENLVEQIIAENNGDRDKILKDINKARPHEWAVSNETRGWVVVDIYTGRIKLIGMSDSSGKNHYDMALKEAIRRNREYGIVTRPKMLTAIPVSKEVIKRKAEWMRVPQVNFKYLAKLNRMR